jgi:2'-phosphotransferase
VQINEGVQPPVVRATQGHSVQLEKPILQVIGSSDEVAEAIHVTRQDTWQAIQQDGFLRRMNRTHIHFATSPSLARSNKWANCFLRLKVAEALHDGVLLAQSTNGVILCAGPLAVKYVEEVAGFSCDL